MLSVKKELDFDDCKVDAPVRTAGIKELVKETIKPKVSSCINEGPVNKFVYVGDGS